MTYRMSHFSLFLLTILLAPFSFGDEVSLRRFLSYTIRDQPLSPNEAQDIANGTTSLDDMIDVWLAEDSHKNRIRRFFNDQFGANDDFSVLQDNFFLLQSETMTHDKARSH